MKIETHDHEADALDVAARVTQEAAERSIAAIRQQAASISTTNPSGECWHCGESTGEARRWCSVDCRNTWSLMNE